MKNHRFLVTVWLFILSILAVSNFAIASDSNTNSRPESVRIQSLTGQLRCLTCLNETVASSQTAFASQVRTQVGSMIQSGFSATQIMDTLESRYGQDILMTPTAKDAPFLWALPWVLVFVVTGSLVLVIRQKSKAIPKKSNVLQGSTIPPTPPSIHGKDL